jgi:hypothetical protein
MTKEFPKVCITDEKSIPYNATNSSELIENIKEQIVSKIEKGDNIGVLGSSGTGPVLLERAAFLYENPRICHGKLYVDLKVLDTPCGKILQQLLNDTSTCRTAVEGTGIIEDNKSITDYTLKSVSSLIPEAYD